MRINNISGARSWQGVASMSVFSGIFFIFFLYTYISSTVGEHSVLGFCLWYCEWFKALCSSPPEVYIISWFAFLGVPLLSFVMFTLLFVNMYIENQKFAKTLNLKSVDFLPDKVCFYFNQPQCDFVCAYSDINKMELVLKTILVRGKYDVHAILSHICINFTVLNSKRFSLTNIPLNVDKTIYNIIDYGKLVPKFVYRFSGAGQVEEIKEKIHDYQHIGCKQILAQKTEDKFNSWSITFYLTAFYWLYRFRDYFNGASSFELCGTILFPCIFLISSLCIDLLLIFDNLNEVRCLKRYEKMYKAGDKHYNLQKNLDEDFRILKIIPPIYILIIKLVIFMLLIQRYYPNFYFDVKRLFWAIITGNIS